MADVSRRVRADGNGRDRAEGGDGRGDRRAQLFLLGALALATLFVALALFLNGVIYAGTLATDDAGADTDRALAYRGATDGVVRSVNAEYHGNYAALNEELRATVERWSADAGRHSAARGVAANASLVEGETVYGALIGQRDASRNFTDDDGNESWTLVADSRVRAYELVVDRSAGTSGSTFRIVLNATEWTDARELSVTRTSDGVVVSADGAGECEVSDSRDAVRVDVTGGTVGGRSCPALDAVGWGPNATMTVAYRNGDALGGTYSLVTAKNASEIDGAPYAGTVSDAGGPSEPPAAGPYRSAAVYAAELRLTYRSPSLAYETNVRVAPDEADD